MTTPAAVEQPTTAQPQRLLHCICGGCNPDVYAGPLTRPVAALCGHVCSVGSRDGVGPQRCVVCDDLEPTHICPPREAR